MTSSSSFRTLVLDHAPVDVRSGWALFAVGCAFVLLGLLDAGEYAFVAYAAGGASMLIGGLGAALYQANKLKADRMGIWEQNLLGVERGIAWSEVKRIEAPRWLEIESESGARIQLDPKRIGVPALSVLILQRVPRHRISRAAYRKLRQHARPVERAQRAARAQRALLSASRKARASFAERSGISS